MQSNDPIDLTVDPRDILPQVIKDEWLPDEAGSVLYLFQGFNWYPPHPSPYVLPSNLQSVLHQDKVQEFDHQSLLTIGPPPSTILEVYQNAIKKTAIKKTQHPVHSISFQLSYGDLIRLPVWVFSYWAEIGHAVHFQKKWRIALTWVQKHSVSPMAKELCSPVLLGLSSVSWSQVGGYTCDIIPLFADSSRESYLTSFHIDHIISQTKAEFEKSLGPHMTNCHIFATVDHIEAIIRFYGNVRAGKRGHLWDKLMMAENSIIRGEVNTLGDVIHLPEHWVSVVVDFQQQQILYGDSLGQKIPRREYHALEHWIKHLVNRSSKLPVSDKITVHQLPTGHQEDASSCGLFALNAITHHYLKHPLLDSGPIILACRRMEIALDITGSMTVCLFYSL
jgi:hypothetical protein